MVFGHAAERGNHRPGFGVEDHFAVGPHREQTGTASHVHQRADELFGRESVPGGDPAHE
jgi:hypothetical protein